MKRGSLRTQLIAWNIVALAVLLCVLGLVIRYTIVSSLMLSVDRSLEQQMRAFSMPRRFKGHSGPPPDDMPFRDAPAAEPFGWSELFGRQDRHHGEPFGRHSGPPLDLSLQTGVTLEPRHFDLSGNAMGPRQMLSTESFAVARTGRTDFRRIVVDGEPQRVLSMPLRERGAVVGVGQVAYRLTEIDLAISTLDTALLTLLPVGLLCAAGGGLLLTNRVLSRVRRTAQAAEKIIGGEGTQAFAARLPVSGNDEFSELSTTFNGLLGHLETAFQQQAQLLDQQRRFTADASHELKTPLTVIKGTASMALGSGIAFSEEEYRHALKQINQASTQMSTLVQDLLLLARADSQQMGLRAIDLLVSEIVEQAVRAVPTKKHRVVIQIDDPLLTVHGNENELTRLVTNLLDNAVRYTPPGGTVTVTACGEEAHIVLRVIDTGSGIAPEHLPHLGERFYRADAARTREDGGTGLGLSICCGIVLAHGGTLHIDSTLGEGTRVTVRFPHLKSSLGKGSAVQILFHA